MTKIAPGANTKNKECPRAVEQLGAPGAYLRELRLSKGIQIRELARLLRVSEAYICMIERGQKRGSDGMRHRMYAALLNCEHQNGDPSRRRRCALCLNVGHYSDDCELSA